MTVFGIGLGTGSAEPDDTPTVEPPPAITTGQTVTETTASTEPEIPEASPSVSATTPPEFAHPH